MKSKTVIHFVMVFLMVFVYVTSFSQKLEEEEYEEVPADTVITKASLAAQHDSLTQLKNRREFSYIHYLDSLLRKEKPKADSAMAPTKQAKPKSNLTYLNTILNSGPIKIFFWLMAIAFIFYIIYKIFMNKGIFLKGSGSTLEEENENETLVLEEYEKYNELIHSAEQNQELNMASRYLYLQTIKNLSDKGLINFSSDKTNNDYLHEMEAHEYYQQFKELTINYDYIWYGKFSITLEKYHQLKQSFILFNKNI